MNFEPRRLTSEYFYKLVDVLADLLEIRNEGTLNKDRISCIASTSLSFHNDGLLPKEIGPVFNLDKQNSDGPFKMKLKNKQNNVSKTFTK